MLYSQVTIKIDNPNHPTGQVWFVFASDHDDLADLHRELSENGTVYGWRLDTRPAGDRRRQEVSRREQVVGRDAILTIQPLHYALECAEGEVAA